MVNRQVAPDGQAQEFAELACNRCTGVQSAAVCACLQHLASRSFRSGGDIARAVLCARKSISNAHRRIPCRLGKHNGRQDSKVAQAPLVFGSAWRAHSQYLACVMLLAELHELSGCPQDARLEATEAQKYAETLAARLPQVKMKVLLGKIMCKEGALSEAESLLQKAKATIRGGEYGPLLDTVLGQCR
ncbi:unnamed protein product [Ostreobium quekettii]|uniref:Uncharacterized protein n=1 Tax=Ostreobium quekettii TaxID=121088 RepID=A0A8S1JC90_9CHLO|nr:unnamed protein product [Ostreobium quekettii]